MYKLKSIIILSISLASLTAGCTTAQSPEPETPNAKEALEWMVLQEINSAYFNREEPMNRPALVKRVPDGVIREVDVSHDGVTDWLIDYTESGLMYCGTGGCLRSLYVSAGEGDYILAFNDQSDELVIRERNNETVIDMNVHRVMCWPLNDQCSYSFAWNPDLKRLVERPNVRGETLLSSSFAVLAPPASDPPRPPEGAPQILETRWYETLKACPSAVSDGGFNILHASLYSTPDLDGDNVRDWFFENPRDCESGDGSSMNNRAFEIHLSRSDGGAQLAFTSEPGEQPVYDIAAKPAVLISNPECGFEDPCRNLRLQWDSRAASFVAAAAAR